MTEAESSLFKKCKEALPTTEQTHRLSALRICENHQLRKSHKSTACSKAGKLGIFFFLELTLVADRMTGKQGHLIPAVPQTSSSPEQALNLSEIQLAPL